MFRLGVLLADDDCSVGLGEALCDENVLRVFAQTAKDVSPTVTAVM